jgi:ribosomal protein S18 acetylase RimI-like enzyme
MPEDTPEVTIRPASELDIGDVVRIDEQIGGEYRPEVWERRLGYYIRRDPDASVVAVASDGRVVGFMLGEVRSGEFGLEHPTGWLEVLGVDPDFRGRAVGRLMAEAMLEHFREQGATEVRTRVDEEQRGDVAGFVRSLGFEPAPLKPMVRRL